MAGGERQLCATVRITESCRKVEEAFEYPFDGTSTTTLHSIRDIGALIGPAGQKSRIIVLTGPSGSGKTSELRRLVGELGLSANFSGGHVWPRPNLGALSWHGSGPVREQLGGSASEAAALLRAVALPERCWLRPYGGLSSGEQSRADIARRLALGERHIGVSSSPQDRDTARRVCSGVAKLVRARGLTLCVSTIWQDIVPALLPDICLLGRHWEGVRVRRRDALC
ncbi:unnamed protein product [Prorocentrum cordatum]|uniref:ATP-binding cassette domain-containing protein n=1 Tax=Prorocentrum cordatum TaxID=2364126 RepID=A0ABN9RS93_9DINO|nr:unnamed protein product [Polarella glacialis]